MLLGSSPAMREAARLVALAAPSDATVLIRGETGTGKEVAARELHGASPRASQAFVKIDCAALPDTLLESELFGYEKGAFTGAAERKLGRVETAHKGTLFLDEIGELPPPLQAKLLRLLQDRTFERLGSTTTTTVDVRIVAATHRDLETMIERGEFRQDLFYRLNVVPIWLPPLRARRADIAVLAQQFCASHAASHDKSVTLDDAALRVLRAQRWPGNVRQLQNFVERLVVLAETSTITARDVEEQVERQVEFRTETNEVSDAAGSGHLSEEVRAAERNALVRALADARGNRAHAARLLGISRSHLYKKLTEHGLL